MPPTAQARSINAQTAMQWNQYMYESSVESSRIYLANKAKREAKEKSDIGAIRDRVRNNPNSVDIADGSALNSALTELDKACPPPAKPAVRKKKAKAG